MKREINNTDSKKSAPKGDIPVKIVKWNSNTIALIVRECFDQNVRNLPFLN